MSCITNNESAGGDCRRFSLASDCRLRGMRPARSLPGVWTGLTRTAVGRPESGVMSRTTNQPVSSRRPLLASDCRLCGTPPARLANTLVCRSLPGVWTDLTRTPSSQSQVACRTRRVRRCPADDHCLSAIVACVVRLPPEACWLSELT